MGRIESVSIIREIELAAREFSANNGYSPERIFVPTERATELVDALSDISCGYGPLHAVAGVMRVCGMVLHFGGDRIEARAPELTGFVYPWSKCA